MSSRALRRGFTLLVIVAVAAAVLWTVKARRAAPPPAAPAAAERIMELAAGDVTVVAKAPLQPSIPLSGTLQPHDQTVVKTKVAGELVRVLVREGERVGAGQLLAQVDDTELRARLAERRAALTGSQAQRDLARKNWATTEQLLSQNFISRNAADSAASALAVAEANVAAAEAQLELAGKALADARIASPMAGIVAERFAQPGEKLPVDARVLSLVDLSRLELAAEVPASDIAAARVGGQVEFRVDGMGAQLYRGTVERINPTADPRSRMVRVYVRLDNAGGELKGGMFAKGRLASSTMREALMIPAGTVRDEGGESVVMVLEGEVVRRRPVTLGLRDEAGDAVEVVSGLEVGEKVLNARLGNLRTGDRVRVGPRPRN
jgi:membrane fusion protein (multidrug efflux system)